MSSQEEVNGVASNMKSLPFSSSLSISSKGSKQTDDSDKMKVKIMEAWNNFKFELQEVTELNLKKNTPLWLLGNIYLLEQVVEYDSYSDVTNEKVKMPKVQSQIKEFFDDFASKPWFTYRKSFTPFSGTTLKSDTGWGCMIRSTQMIICQGFLMHFLGRDWRYLSMKPDQLKAKRLHREIISWFIDEPNKRCPFSIHRLTEIGLNYKYKPGDWYGPSTVAYIMQDALECGKGTNDKLNKLVIYVAQDCTVYSKDVRGMCRWGEKEASDRSVIILIPLRLGESTLNPIYTSYLQNLFKFKQCIGIVGGKPKHSLYFVGVQDNYILYLDPHYSQSSDTLENFSNKQLQNYHCTSPRKMLISKLDPSCCVGFYCRDETEFKLFASNSVKYAPPSSQKLSFHLYLIAESSVRDHKYETKLSDFEIGVDSDLDKDTIIPCDSLPASPSQSNSGQKNTDIELDADASTSKTDKFPFSLSKPKEFFSNFYSRQISRSPKSEHKKVVVEEEFEFL